jgi:hypothetical protein
MPDDFSRINQYYKERQECVKRVNSLDIILSHAYTSAVIEATKGTDGLNDLEKLLSDSSEARTKFSSKMLAVLDQFVKDSCGMTSNFANDFQRSALYQGVLGFSDASLQRYVNEFKGAGLTSEDDFLKLVGRGISQAWGEHTDRGSRTVQKELLDRPIRVLRSEDAAQVVPYLVSKNTTNGYITNLIDTTKLSTSTSLIARLLDEQGDGVSRGYGKGIVTPEFLKAQPYYKTP